MTRTMIVTVDDDPLAPAEMVVRLLRKGGFPEDRIFRLASGAHLPLEIGDFVSRNVHDIAAVIDAVLETTRVTRGAPTPADFAPDDGPTRTL
jgi:hypothetical protein